jgi:MoxR-like ATPase
MKWYDVLQAIADNDAFGKVDGVTRILLAGLPGTGKSTWPAHSLPGQKIERVHLTEDSGPEDLIGTWSLKDNSTEFLMGPGARAMARGQALVVDEIDRGSQSVQSVLHAILDDPDIAQITLPNGLVVKPKNTGGFTIFATMNGNPSHLDEALLDRFDIVLICKDPHPAIIESLPEEVGAAVQKHYDAKETTTFHWSPEITVRTALSFVKLRDVLGVDDAAVAVWGPKGHEIISVFASQIKADK